MPRRIEGGPSTRHAHEQMSFPFPGVNCLFLVCFFFGVFRAERDELCHAMPTGTAPTDPQDSQQGFNPLTGGTGSWVVTARPKPWREIGQFGLGLSWLARRPRAVSPSKQNRTRTCRLCTCWGWYGVLWAAMSNKQFPTAEGGGGWSGSGRQPPMLEHWRSSFVARSVHPPVRPSAALVPVVVEATGHVTDGVQQYITHSRAVAPQAKPDQSSDSTAAAGSFFFFLLLAAGESSSLASPVGLRKPPHSPPPSRKKPVVCSVCGLKALEMHRWGMDGMEVLPRRQRSPVTV